METFFTKDKNFYKVFFRLMLVVALQNLVAYSVNMLDNMMLHNNRKCSKRRHHSCIP